MFPANFLGDARPQQQSEKQPAMKIRWTRDSLRLRITPLELRALERGDRVAEILSLPGGNGWSVAVQPGASETTLTANGGQVFFLLSDVDRERLGAPDAEGVYFGGDGQPPFRYSLEKDFPCVHPRAADAREPATETFQAPEDFAARKA